jgi:hypothetical protein
LPRGRARRLGPGLHLVSRDRWPCPLCARSSRQSASLRGSRPALPDESP